MSNQERDKEILRLWQEDGLTYRELGVMFEISHAAVGQIVNKQIGRVENNSGLGGRRSPRLEKLYKFIVQYKTDHDGNSPTVREMVEAGFYSSSSAVSHALETLAAFGRIKLSHGAARSVEIPGGRWLPPVV